VEQDIKDLNYFALPMIYAIFATVISK